MNSRIQLEGMSKHAGHRHLEVLRGRFSWDDRLVDWKVGRGRASPSMLTGDGQIFRLVVWLVGWFVGQ